MNKICKVIYYVFMAWIVITGTVGTYSVIATRSTNIQIMTMEEKLSAFEKTALINREINDLYADLGYEYSITLYRVTQETAYHPQKVDVITSVGSKSSAISTEYWKDEPNYVGYKNFNDRLLRDKVVYIGDVTKEKDIYIGRTKTDLDITEVKAMYGVVIKVEKIQGSYGLVLASPDSISIERVDFYYKTRQTAKNIKTILEK